jgi:alpha-D-ribose 1-methylphosphonate 5-triphosphate synthase subunit PhnH
MMSQPSITPGFSDIVQDSQHVFRRVLEATSNPGRIVEIDARPQAPEPMAVATAAVALTLCDFETPVWLDEILRQQSIEQHLRFHAGCPLVSEQEKAALAFFGAPASLTSLEGFAIGTDEYPDRSATLVLQVYQLGQGPAVRLEGPGIESTVEVRVAGLPPEFWSWARDNHTLFPLGLDFLFTCGNKLMAIPRSSRIL